MRIAGIEPESIVDGEGYRYVIFLQGCLHHCKGCHNPSTWSFDGGRIADCHTIIEEAKKNPLLSGITISGGEPFLQYEDVLQLMRLAHEAGFTVWIYTGYTVEELLKQNNDIINTILNKVDVIVDGRFILAERDLSLIFKGSRNQRVLTKTEVDIIKKEFYGKKEE